MIIDDDTVAAALAEEDPAAQASAADEAAPEADNTDTTDSTDTSADNTTGDTQDSIEPVAPADTTGDTQESDAQETPAAEAPAQTADDDIEIFGDGEVDEQDQAASETAVQTQEASTGQIYIKGNDNPFNTLEEAIAAASAVEDPSSSEAPITQIIITGTLELSQTVTIDGKKNISIAAGGENTIIKRAEGFTGDMFKVTGGSVLQFAKGTDPTTSTEYGLTVDATSTQFSTGSTILVETDSYFGLNDKVTLTGNQNGIDCEIIGTVIRNIGGTVVLSGGIIDGNQYMREDGAIVYSEGDILISGTVIIREGDIDNDRPVVLANKGMIHVVGPLTGTDIRFRVNDPADQRAVIDVAKDPSTNALYLSIADALQQIKYVKEDSSTYEIDENGKMKDTAKPAEQLRHLLPQQLLHRPQNLQQHRFLLLPCH